ncbi:integrase core domain-containing protein [Solirubrobacter ginsenosidimutans]|uniref:Integrase core domain-containing protein n=1 Tax=Solirubrobacter ginsenosidimutans TaxID=490573 RepID=A0A9X3S1Z8_9ACTN|nr:integrase core domain-containing protein [Solirubrobacter ginsenosidimutans]MDA0160651.1 integrase core domain-containing protein [Solirubrobacter ginsenosidimutans]
MARVDFVDRESDWPAAYTPRWNGKVERFHQTMEREWAKGPRYRNSTTRNRALPHWLEHYNQRRPHSSLGAHNLHGHDN